MSSHHGFSRARCAALALLLSATLVAPATSRAAQRSFASGSLIIPASIEYQSNDGLIATYALVYSVLYLNAQLVAQGKQPIRFYWAIAPNKLSTYRCDTMHSDPSVAANMPDYTRFNDNDGCDFYVERDVGQPVSLVNQTGGTVAPFNVNDITYDSALGPSRASSQHAIGSSTKMVKYLGGSWIVDSTDAAAFLLLLRNQMPSIASGGLAQYHGGTDPNPNNTTTGSNYINIHVANHDFVAPVASVVTQRPPLIALIGSNGQTDKLTDVFANAGLCGSAGFFVDGSSTPCSGSNGVVYRDFTGDTDTLLGNATGSTGTLNNTATNAPVYGLLWLGDGAFNNSNATIPSYQLSTIRTFLDNKGNVFAEYNSVGAMETGAFQSTAGVDNVPSTTDVSPNEDCNDSSSFTFYRGSGGACVIYKGTNLPFAQSGNFFYQEGGNGNWEGYAPDNNGAFRSTTIPVVREGPVSSPGGMVASVSYKDNDTNKGVVMYLAGHKYTNPEKFWGERLILNTVFARTIALTEAELSRSEPVGYVNTNGATGSAALNGRVYQGTYVERLLPDVTAMVTYDQTNPTLWQFPYMFGHLYQYDLSSLSSTAQAFGSATWTWDAGALLYGGTPMPASRNVWTYVAGSAHAGWKKIDFKYTEVTNAGATGCTADANGICYLSKALLSGGNAAGIQLSALGSPANQPAQARALGMLVSQIRGSCAAAGASGTTVYAPADGDCDPRTSTATDLPTRNRARLGGIDHGSPAVVGVSRYITGAPWNKRPVVAYAGGHDGMLHAFYVSNWDGGTTPSWPGGSTATVTNFGLFSGVVPGQELWAIVPPGQVGLMYSNNALVDGSINVVDVFGDFPSDKNGDGVIDWSTSQCTGARANQGTSCERPTGIRSWRTVLIATAGKGSSQYGIGGAEMFALDVTNPLAPVLLWHVGGATENDKRTYNQSNGSWAAFDAGGIPADPAQFALKWYDWDDGDSHTAHIPTDYNTTDPDVIDALKTSRYDYSNLGLAYSTAVAKVWSGNGYQYVLFVTTNAASFSPADPSTLFSNPWYTPSQTPAGGLRGAEVFAIDLITGQKLWQWEHRYASLTGPGVDNSVPPRMALGDIDANGSTDRIYLGDLEGHLWELSARDGRNWNYLLDTHNVRHSLPLFGTAAMTGSGADATITTPFKLNDGTTALSQQPLTTPIGQGRFTSVPADQVPYLVNRLAILVGTMGVDWTIAPYEAGHIFVIPVSPDMGTRQLEPIDMNQTRDPQKFGILLPFPTGHSDQVAKHAWWDIPLGTGERVFGMPRVANNQIVFNTAFGSFTGDISATVTDPGKFWSVVTNTSGQSQPTATANDSKSFGGVVIVGTSVVISTDDKIKKIAGQVTLGDVNTSPFNRATPAAVKSWEVVPK